MTKNEQIKASIAKTSQRRKSQICRVYKVKIDESRLSVKQKEQLKMLFIEAKWFYNWLLANKENLSSINAQKIHTIEKLNKDKQEETVELRFIKSSQRDSVLEGIKSSLKTMKSLREKGIQKHGTLKFTSEYKSIELKQFGITHKIRGKRAMIIQGISKKVPVNGLKQLPENCDIANAKLLNTPTGYYVALTTYSFKNDVKEVAKTKPIIGIDFGCQTSLIYSDGRTKTTIAIGETEHLKRLQRKLAKQTKGSNNRNRTKKLINIEYQKISNRKNDITNKIVAELKQHKLVVIQDEQLASWQKNHHGKAIQHSCLGRIKTKLKQLDNCIVLSKDIPTTKICMNCGKVHEMKLSDRAFQCDCGIKEDRDIHAAKNMLEIFKMLSNTFQIPLEQRKFKREEFLEAYEKKFRVGYGTMRHEDATFQGCH